MAVDIEKLAIFLSAVVLMIFSSLWILFFHRIGALILGWIVNLILWKKNGDISSYFRVKSIYIAPLGGKILFRNLQFTTKDYSIYMIDGIIIISWWNLLRNSDSKLKVRLHGLEVLFYDNSSLYESLMKKKKKVKKKFSFLRNILGWFTSRKSKKEEHEKDTLSSEPNDFIDTPSDNALKKRPKKIDNEIPLEAGFEDSDNELPEIDNDQAQDENMQFKQDNTDEPQIKEFERPKGKKSKLKGSEFYTFKGVMRWIGCIKFVVRKGNVLVGNYKTPSYVQIGWKLFSGKFFIDEVSSENPENILQTKIDDIKLRIINNADQNKKSIPHHLKHTEVDDIVIKNFADRYKELFNEELDFITFDQPIFDSKKKPPVTNAKYSYGHTYPNPFDYHEIDQSTILECSQVNILFSKHRCPNWFRNKYYEQPKMQLKIEFDKFINGTILYGPWSDHQRAIIQEFLSPKTYKNIEKLVFEEGAPVGIENFDLYILFKYPILWRIPFIRTPEREEEKKRGKGKLETFDVKIDGGSHLKIKYPLLLRGSTSSIEVMIDFKNVSAITSNTKALFGEAEQFRGQWDFRYAPEWNGPKEFVWNWNFTKGKLFFLWEHIQFIQDFIKDWTNWETTETSLLEFTPSNYVYTFNFFDFNLLMSSNANNIIDIHNDMESNTYMDVKVPHFQVIFSAEYSKYNPETSTLDFDINFFSSKSNPLDTPEMLFKLAKNHPLKESLDIENSTFLMARKALIHGKYEYFNKIKKNVLDTFKLDIDINDVSGHINGCYIRLFITWFINYFAYNSKHLTSKEYEMNGYKNDKGRQIWLLQITDEDGFRFLKNSIEYVVVLKLHKGQASLPLNMHTKEEEVVTVFAEDIYLEARYLPEYLDLTWSVSPITAEFPVHEKATPNSRRKYIGCTGMTGWGKMPTGPAPDHNFYIMEMEFLFGNVTGEVTPWECRELFYTLRNLVKQFFSAFPPSKYDDIPPVYNHREFLPSEISKNRPIFLKVGIDSIQGLLCVEQDNINITLSKGFTLEYSSLNDQKTNSHLFLEISNIDVEFLAANSIKRQKNDETISCKSVAHFTTGIFLRRYFRNPTVIQDYESQQEFLEKNGASEIIRFGLGDKNKDMQNIDEDIFDIYPSEDDSTVKEEISNVSDLLTDEQEFQEFQETFSNLSDDESFDSFDSDDSPNDKKKNLKPQLETVTGKKIELKDDIIKRIQEQLKDILKDAGNNSQENEDDNYTFRDERNRYFPVSSYAEFLKNVIMILENTSVISPLNYSSQNMNFPHISSSKDSIGLFAPFPFMTKKDTSSKTIEEYHHIHSSTESDDSLEKYTNESLKVENIQEKCVFNYISLQFTTPVDIFITPHIVDSIGNIFNILLSPLNRNLSSICDDIEFSIKPNIKTNEAPAVPPEFPSKKITLCCSIPSIKIHVIQAIRSPNLINSVLLKDINVYSTKIIANNIFGALSFSWKRDLVNGKSSSQLQSVESSFTMSSLRQVSQCLSKTKDVYHGISDYYLNSEILKSLSSAHPSIVSLNVEDISMNSVHKLDKEIAQGFIKCRSGKPLEFFSTQEVPLIFFNHVEIWKNSIEKHIQLIKQIRDVNNRAKLILLAGLAKLTGEENDLPSGVNDLGDFVINPDFRTVEPKVALQDVRQKIKNLEIREKDLLKQWIKTSISNNTSVKKLKQSVSFNHWSLIEDTSPTHGPLIQEQIKSSGKSLFDKRFATDLSISVNKLTFSLHSQSAKSMKKSTGSIHNVDLWLQFGVKTDTVNRFSPSQFLSTGTSAHQLKRRDISIISNMNVKSIDVDLHPSSYEIVTIIVGIALGLKLASQIKKNDVKPKVAEALNLFNISIPTETRNRTKSMSSLPVIPQVTLTKHDSTIPATEVETNFNGFFNLNVNNVEARAWMSRGINFAQLSFDSICLCLNKPSVSQSTFDRTSTLNQCAFLKVKTIHFEYNYAPVPKNLDSLPDFVSLFDTTVSNLVVNQFYSTTIKDGNSIDNLYFLPEIGSFNTSIPYTDLWSAASLQLKLFIFDWFEVVKRKPNVRVNAPFDSEIENSPTVNDIGSPPKSDTPSATLRVPIIHLTLDVHKISIQFVLLSTLQMQYSVSRIMFFINKDTNYTSYRFHLFSNSIAFKSDKEENFPEHINPESKSVNLFGSKTSVASFSKLFLLPECMVYGDVSTNEEIPKFTSNIYVDYLENVIVGEIVNYIMSVQSSVIKEINNIVQIFQSRFNKEEITERIKSELPKAQASVKKLNIHFDVNLQFDGLHFTVFSSASALILNTGKIQIGVSRKVDGIKWKVDCNNAFAELVDLGGFKWSDKREFNGRYSSWKNCYKFLSFSTNISFKNKVEDTITVAESSTASRKIDILIENTRVYMRPGSPQIAILLFKDYQESLKNLISELKESRKHLNTDIFKRLIETGEEYYTYYSEKIVKSVTTDPTFIYSGIIRVTNSSLTIPVGDNPYFGFLQNYNPSFSPNAVIHVILDSIDLTTRTIADPSNKNTIRGIIVARNGYVYVDNCAKNDVRNQSYNPTVVKFEESSQKCHFPDATMGIDFNLDGNIIRTKVTSTVSGPLLSVNPKILSHILDLKNDWFSFSNLNSTSNSEIMDQLENVRVKAPKILKEGESTISFLKQKLHITSRFKVMAGECKFHHTLNVPTQTDEKPIWNSISNKNNDNPSIVAIATLPSFLVDVVHVSPSILALSTSGTSTHLQINVDWKGIRLDPKSVLFINEAWYTYSEFKKKKKRRFQYSQIEATQKLENVSKPERWMRYVVSAIAIQRVFRGYLIRKLLKEMRNQGIDFKKKKEIKKNDKQPKVKDDGISLNANSISLLCRIQPFTISMTTSPVSDIITSIEFSKPFDILFTRMHRHLHRKNEQGNAIFNTVFLNSPDILIRMYNKLNPDEFMRFIISGVIANIGAGYGPLLRPDREATISGTVSIENIRIKFNLPQINQLFLMYSLWMEKTSEAKKALANRISKVQVTSRIRKNFMSKENELSLESTMSKYGQIFIKKIEFASDLDYMIGKQRLEVYNVSLFIRDRGRYLNSINREALHIGGYMTRAKMELTGRLRGTIESFGITFGFDHDFAVGGANPTFRGKSNLKLKILPIELSIDYNMEKIINLYSESIYCQFKDVFDVENGSKSHIQSKFSLETIILRLSSGAAPAFIKIFYSILDTLKNRRNNTLKVLQRSVFYYHHDSVISDEELEKDIQRIKQLNVRSPIDQFKDLNILGHVTLFGSNLTIFLHDKFNLNEKNQLKEMEGRMRGDYTSFGVEEFQVKFVRNAQDLSKSSSDNLSYNIQRNIQLFALKADIYHNTISSQPISLIRVPGGSIVMRSIQSNKESKISYDFSSRFPDSITVSTNFAEYKFLREMLGYYQDSVKKEISVKRGDSDSNSFAFTETDHSNSTSSEKSPFSALLEQDFVGNIHFNPKLDVLGDMTPSVETVLGWLGIKDRSLVAKLTHMFLSNSLEGVLIGCKNISDGIQKVMTEKKVQ